MQIGLRHSKKVIGGSSGIFSRTVVSERVNFYLVGSLLVCVVWGVKMDFSLDDFVCNPTLEKMLKSRFAHCG